MVLGRVCVTRVLGRCAVIPVRSLKGILDEDKETPAAAWRNNNSGGRTKFGLGGTQTRLERRGARRGEAFPSNGTEPIH